MLQNLKFFRSSSPFLPRIAQAQTPPPRFSTTIFPGNKQQCKLSRRELTICSNSSLLLLLVSQIAEPFVASRARAEENSPASPDANKPASPDAEEPAAVNNSPASPNADKPASPDAEESVAAVTNTNTGSSYTNKAFLDVSIDGEPVGRIIIGLYGNDAIAGAARFRDLVTGAAGISYRRKEFIKIVPNYIKHGGVRSYGVDSELAKRSGSKLEADYLLEEWEKQNEKGSGTKNLARAVGIIVRNPTKPPPNLKVVARNGKLEIDQEEVGTNPNGTEFVIVTEDSPELDESTLVVGSVLEGMEVVERIGKVKTVNENTSSPYFRVAKFVGDKRAVVAERGFNRPYSKVLITNCGLMDS